MRPKIPLEFKIVEDIELTDSGCWLWTKRLDKDGYGKGSFPNGETLAHRASYSLLVGKIPSGLEIDHLCRVRRCVNPAHMEAVNRVVHGRRSANARLTHCKSGHRFDEANTLVRANGSRACRRCAADASARCKRNKIRKLEAV